MKRLMTQARSRLVGAAGTGLCLMAIHSGAALAGQGAAKSVNDGVYSEAQAGRGQKVFETICASCHETKQFTDPEFVKLWAGKPLYGLFDVTRTTMPQDSPGSLEAQQYADVLAYLLQLNKFPAGEQELTGTDEAMKAVQMDAPKAAGQGR